MAESMIDVRGLTKGEAYRTLKAQLDAVCEEVTDPIAVLDIDSAHLAAFDEEDGRQLESWVARFAR